MHETRCIKDPGGHIDLHYVAIFLMTSQILKFMDLRKTQKPEYLEKETLLFLQIKKNSLITYQGLLYEKE